MRTEDGEPFTANPADRLEQQEDVSEESADEPEEPLPTATQEANEADVAEQARSVSGDDDYPRGPIEDEPV